MSYQHSSVKGLNEAFNKAYSRRYRDLKITNIIPAVDSNLSNFKINCKNTFPEIHMLPTGTQQNLCVCVCTSMHLVVMNLTTGNAVRK